MEENAHISSRDSYPLVSVIVPAWNAAPFIGNTLRSALMQTWQQLEIIVVDDGSTDQTAALVRELQLADNRILLIEKPNSGVSDTRNAGLEIARGAYVAFLDADDTWLPENVQEKIETIERTGAHAVYSPGELIDENGNLTGIILSGTTEPVLSDLLLFRGNFITAPSALLVKREVISTVGKFDPLLSNNADQDFWMRILAAGFRIVRTDKTSWQYRVHGNNMSGNIALLEKDSIYLLKKITENGLLANTGLQRRSTALLYRMLAGSWWKQGSNKKRACYFLWRALLSNPLIILNRKR